ncbi:MAG: hypothetical protein MK135_00375 [Polyangiaceae bacterium]|nr:hypothetical protein [Polyangiaceae bacterium]
MIIITGTKRSGTSMWMQILQASGIQVLGPAFNKSWKETIEDANKRGFYETRFRKGIYYATNPNPVSGKWLSPKVSRHWGVKVFIPGVVRSDIVYLSRVIASVRPWRQYTTSLRRLYEMEEKAHREKGTGDLLSKHLDPILEWWLENFLLIRDITTRRYPARLISYETMVSEPDRICDRIIPWLGAGDPKKAAEAVHPEDRTQHASSSSNIEHEFAEVFDEYHERIKTETPFDESFLSKMNETHEALLPEIEEALAQLSAAALQLKEKRQKAIQEGTWKGKPEPQDQALNPDRLAALLHSSS